MDVEITCVKCKQMVAHQCNTELRGRLLQMLTVVPENQGWLLDKTKKVNSEFYEDGDEKAPFFQERYQYPLWGKEDARTMIAVVDNVITAAGFDPIQMREDAWLAHIAGLGKNKRGGKQ